MAFSYASKAKNKSKLNKTQLYFQGYKNLTPLFMSFQWKSNNCVCRVGEKQLQCVCKVTMNADKDISKQYSEVVWVDWQRCITVALVTDAKNLQDN